jgi:transposase
MDDWQGLTDEEWDRIQNLFPKFKKPFRKAKRKGGRPRASDRKAFEAILWKLSGGTLERLPPRFGSRRTACRRVQLWFGLGVLDRAWGHYIRRLDEPRLRLWAQALAANKRPPFWMEMLTVSFRVENPRLHVILSRPARNV